MVDQQVFTKYWVKAQPVLSSFVFSLAPDFDEAQDIIQETALVLHDEFDKYDPESSFAAWAIGIARNRLLMKHRTKSKNPLIHHSDFVERLGRKTEEMSAELEKHLFFLRGCIKNLPEENYKIIELRYQDDLKPREIAARLGFAPGYIRTVLSRIRSALNDCIQKKSHARARHD